MQLYLSIAGTPCCQRSICASVPSTDASNGTPKTVRPSLHISTQNQSGTCIPFRNPFASAARLSTASEKKVNIRTVAPTCQDKEPNVENVEGFFRFTARTYVTRPSTTTNWIRFSARFSPMLSARSHRQSQVTAVLIRPINTERLANPPRP